MTADEVYDVLVAECGAPETLRDAFLTAWARNERLEFRFQGNLGFGGKVYRNIHTLPRFFVGCYPEDRTPERDAAINRANDLFKSGV